MPKKVNLFDERVKRLTDASQGRIPDRVPVTSLIETYALSYSGTSIAQTQKSVIKHVLGYGQIYKDVYFDAAFTPCLSHALSVGWALGSDVFFISDDEFTLQHKEYCPMSPEDYEAFNKDPVMWVLDEFLPRKFPRYDATNEQQIKAFKDTLIPFVKFALGLLLGSFYFKNNLKVPVMVSGSAEMPCDMLFDYVRGFKGTVMDIRRNPKEIEQGINALLDYCMDLIKMTQILMSSSTASPKWILDNAIRSVIGHRNPKFLSFPWVFNPSHIPPFLSPKQFDEFYWPTYKAMAEYIHNNGGHMLSLLEGEWGQNIDRLKELPPHSVTLILENDDIIDVKKRIGDQFCVMGGMPITKLRECSTRECIDHAKRIVDECAPGGGFIFSTDKVLLGPSDAQLKNLRAVNEFVHVYGQY